MMGRKSTTVTKRKTATGNRKRNVLVAAIVTAASMAGPVVMQAYKKRSARHALRDAQSTSDYARP